MTTRKNHDKMTKRRIKRCGEAVDTLHEVAISTQGSVHLSELLEEMYFTLMASESPLAQDNDKRRESTFLYQIMKESITKLQTVPW